MRKLTAAALLAGLLAVLAIGSLATADSGKKNVKSDPMSGYLETATPGPVSSMASGEFSATIDDAARTISYTLSYKDLEADVTQSHIHFGQRNVSGGISVWLCGTDALPGPPNTPRCPGARSGTISDEIVPADVIGPAGQGIAAGEFQELVDALRAGRAYANVHSTKFPAGEIRGQINDDNQRDD
jgi:CHRD domain-containing protein